MALKNLCLTKFQEYLILFQNLLNFSTLSSTTDFYNISVLVVTSAKESKTRMVNNSMVRYNLVIGCDETKDATVCFKKKDNHDFQLWQGVCLTMPHSQWWTVVALRSHKLLET